MRIQITVLMISTCVLGSDWRTAGLHPAVTSAAVSGNPASAVFEPTLGYVVKSSLPEVRPISGTPVAARTGDAIVLPRGIQSVFAGPSAAYAISGEGSGGLGVLSFATLSDRPIDGTTGNYSFIAYSPSGASVVAVSDSNRAQIITGLPDVPRIIWTIDNIATPAATTTNDGGMVLFAEGGQVLLALKDGSRTVVYQGDRIVDIAMSPDGTYAAAADAGLHQVVLIEKLQTTPSTRVVASGAGDPSRIAFLRSGQVLLVADTIQSVALAIDIASGSANRISLPQAATTMQPISSGDAVLLTVPSDGAPGWLFGWSGDSARVWMIPGVPANNSSAGVGHGRRR